MLSIREEIAEIERAEQDAEDNVLKNAPHEADLLISDDWNHGYSRQKAAYPLDWLVQNKYWVPVARVDNAYGDPKLGLRLSAHRGVHGNGITAQCTSSTFF